jgi:hypothetical protein
VRSAALPHLLTRWLRLAIVVAFFATAFALFGGEGWGGRWQGYVAGGLVGLALGLVFAGVRGAWVDWLFPPADGTESGTVPSD